MTGAKTNSVVKMERTSMHSVGSKGDRAKQGKTVRFVDVFKRFPFYKTHVSNRKTDKIAAKPTTSRNDMLNGLFFTNGTRAFEGLRGS